ncbi:MAG: hypothetical protein HFG05_12585 [Oscillibacter sp.]|nr:hypothetical protein [Oscillibacter sp.]
MAAISRIEINTVQLNNDIKHLRTTLSQTRTHMESLRAKMDDMNNMWEGPTNLAMRQRFQGDHERMLALCASLEGLIQTLESIRQSYDTCESNVRSAVDALRV